MLLAIMIFCVIMSGYFSATETAMSTYSKTKIKTLVEKGNKKAALVLKLTDNYDKLLSTILIGNNIVNILLASLGTVLFIKIMNNSPSAPSVSTAVITVVVLIFGEISPKSIAKDMPEKFAMFSAPFLHVLMIVLTPVNFIFTLWKKLLSLIVKNDDDGKMSQEELLMMVDEVEQEGSIDSDESELIKNVIEVTEKLAKDILTHRVDVEAVPITATKEEIATVFTETRFSRLPVYEDTIDNIIGIIHQKDLYVNGKMTEKSIKDLLSPAVFIHEFEQVTDLLKRLQNEKSHIAVVVDEYGGTLGIITMEDILEELVGEIWDEHDEVEEDIEQVAVDTFVVDGSENIDDFFKFFDLECETESVSVGGWISEQLGKIAEKGDTFDYENIRVTVDTIDSHRVESAKVVKIIAEDTEEE